MIFGTTKLDFTNEKGQRCRCQANTGSLCHIFNFDTNEYYTAENREIERFFVKEIKKDTEKVKKVLIIQPTLF
jgi:hypothetical protein